MLHRFGWALTGALTIIAVLALARATTAGPLDPPGPVGSTMRTLDQLLPSWGQTLSSTGGCNSQRFTCVLANEAVLDKETGLVWQRTPEIDAVGWYLASDSCPQYGLGAREGWRLPSRQELQSLREVGNQSQWLPAGHPFTLGTSAAFWSSTSDDQTPSKAWLVAFDNSINDSSLFKNSGVLPQRFWCVRGGTAANVQQPDEQPAWSRALDATGWCSSARFQCVLSGEAVLDRETGLVWQKVPSATARATLGAGLAACFLDQTGGVGGWRLPTGDELSSIGDPTVSTPVKLPEGHPFTLLLNVTYWSSSYADGAYVFGFNAFYGMTITQMHATVGLTGTVAWCVRGPGGDDFN